MLGKSSIKAIKETILKIAPEVRVLTMSQLIYWNEVGEHKC